MIGRFPYQSFNLIPEANILVLQEVKNHPEKLGGIAPFLHGYIPIQLGVLNILV